jgi:chromatin remodeling complex protein RSC6
MAPKKSTEQTTTTVSNTVTASPVSAEKPKKTKKASAESTPVAVASSTPVVESANVSAEKPKKTKKASAESTPVAVASSTPVVEAVTEPVAAVEKPKRTPKKKAQTETSVESSGSSEVTEPVATVEKPKRTPKKKAQAETPVESSETVESSESGESSETSTSTSEKRVRKVVNQETLRVDLEQLKQQVEAEILRLRTDQQKNKGSKFLKAVNKTLKVLSSDLNRVLKSKTKTVRNKNTSSGFMKPVKISSEMALFTKWDPSQLYSRVDVTKFLCNYIRTNQLQNPEDRRQILCDERLSSLLKLDKENQSSLTYPGLQQHIQQHFITDVSSVSEEVAHP